MARNLVAAGHEPVAVDVDPSRAALLGAPVAATPAEAAERCDVALLSLPSPAAVEEVVLGSAGLRAGAAPVRRWTCRPARPTLARKLGESWAGLSIGLLDAPVSGGPRAAEAGSLTVMVGGSGDAFATHRPLLAALGSLVVHVGPAGAGQAAKLCNNLIAGATMVAIAEACAVAAREGIDPAVLYRLLTSSMGDSRVLRTRFPGEGELAGPSGLARLRAALRARSHGEDLDLALELAAVHGVEAPVTTASREQYRAARGAGSRGARLLGRVRGTAPMTAPSPP